MQTIEQESEKAFIHDVATAQQADEAPSAAVPADAPTEQPAQSVEVPGVPLGGIVYQLESQQAVAAKYTAAALAQFAQRCTAGLLANTDGKTAAGKLLETIDRALSVARLADDLGDRAIVRLTGKPS